MPLALDPSFRLALVLDSDAAKPDPPTFYFRAATGREWRQLLQFESTALTAAGRIDALFAQLRMTLCDWRNVNTAAGQAIAFDPAELDALLTPFEADELAGKMLAGARLSAEQKKTSASPPSSNTDSSAGPAEADAAGTNPAPPNPP